MSRYYFVVVGSLESLGRCHPSPSGIVVVVVRSPSGIVVVVDRSLLHSFARTPSVIVVVVVRCTSGIVVVVARSPAGAVVVVVVAAAPLLSAGREGRRANSQTGFDTCDLTIPAAN